MTVSPLERDLTVKELIALIFLVRENKSPEELRSVFSEPEFLGRWRKTERTFEGLIKHYPNEAEEKFFLVANLEAVHDIDPYSDAAQALTEQYRPIIEILLRS